MRYRKLSPTGDYVFGGQQNDFWRDVPDAPAQAVKTRLELWQGEWFLDNTEGTPYLASIVGKHSQSEADAAIKERVTGTQGVVNIENYDSTLDADNRAYAVSMTINTLYGPTQLELDNVGSF